MTPNKGDVMQREDVFAKGAIERIFDGDIVPNVKKNGEIEHIRIRGFHYEDKDVMLARGIEIIEASRTAPDTRGVYRAAIMVRGYRRKAIHYGFFPRAMSRDEILQAIVGAYEHRALVTAGNQELYKGDGGGLKINMQLDDAGRVTDAWPRRARYSRTQRALWVYARTGKRSKLLCPVCLQPKTLCCSHGHWPPRARFYNRLRYRTRRAWFGLLRSLKVIK
jgi:hypothetical protein